MKICPRLLISELSDCALRIFRGYYFSIFLILLFLDRYFGVLDSDLRASPLPLSRMFSYGVPPGWACKRLKSYVTGAKFKIITEHEPCVAIFNKPSSKPPPRIEKWILFLQSYDFTVEYRQGKTTQLTIHLNTGWSTMMKKLP